MPTPISTGFSHHLGRSLTIRFPYLYQPLRRSSCPQHQALRGSWRRQFSTPKQRIVYQNTISLTTAVAIAVAVGASVGFVVGFSRVFNHPTTTEPPIPASSPSQSSAGDMTFSVPPGRPGNLTPEQEDKLRELWQLALQVFGVAEPPTPQPTSPADKTPILARISTGTSAEIDSHAASEKKKKSRLSFLKKPKREEEEYASEAPNGTVLGTSTPSSGKSRISRV